MAGRRRCAGGNRDDRAPPHSTPRLSRHSAAAMEACGSYRDDGHAVRGRRSRVAMWHCRPKRRTASSDSIRRPAAAGTTVGERGPPGAAISRRTVPTCRSSPIRRFSYGSSRSLRLEPISGIDAGQGGDLPPNLLAATVSPSRSTLDQTWRLSVSRSAAACLSPFPRSMRPFTV